ncbi:MAG: hypothetical protein JWM09_1220 [Francisellaceae bacterium]|nr:hypothetical protein [Francisellaceae bacterium]
MAFAAVNSYVLGKAVNNGYWKVAELIAENLGKQLLLNRALPKSTPVEILAFISDYDEGLYQRPQANHLVKEELDGTQEKQQSEIIQENFKKENIIDERNKMLNLMHFELHNFLACVFNIKQQILYIFKLSNEITTLFRLD